MKCFEGAVNPAPRVEKPQSIYLRMKRKYDFRFFKQVPE